MCPLTVRVPCHGKHYHDIKNPRCYDIAPYVQAKISGTSLKTIQVNIPEWGVKQYTE